MAMKTVEIEQSANGKLTRVDIGDLVLWFSYETIVAFHAIGERRCVSENRWGTTTGRHLNEIDGGNKGERVSADEFDRRLAGVVARLEDGLSNAGLKAPSSRKVSWWVKFTDGDSSAISIPADGGPAELAKAANAELARVVALGHNVGIAGLYPAGQDAG